MLLLLLIYSSKRTCSPKISLNEREINHFQLYISCEQDIIHSPARRCRRCRADKSYRENCVNRVIFLQRSSRWPFSIRHFERFNFLSICAHCPLTYPLIDMAVSLGVSTRLQKICWSATDSVFNCTDFHSHEPVVHRLSIHASLALRRRRSDKSGRQIVPCKPALKRRSLSMFYLLRYLIVK